MSHMYYNKGNNSDKYQIEVLMMTDQITKLKTIIDESERIVFFTGAGVSVASGIPDFRSMGGLFDEISKDGYSPEYLLSRDYLNADPEGYINFTHKRLLMSDKAPNPVHEWIAQLEDEGRALGVITQNIDGLHSDAGSHNVDELHGTLNRFYCLNCDAEYTKEEVMEKTLKACERCGGPIRPDIVLYGEMLNQETISRALNKLTSADTLVVLGTSLVVQPAAGLVSNFQGDHFVIINRDETPYDNSADIVIHDDIVDVVEALNDKS